MYIYPDNLKAKATMWLWELKDLAVIGILVLISVFGFAYAKLWFPLIFAGVYADKAITGTKVDKREDFQRLIQDCMDGKIDMVIAKSLFFMYISLC